jgi:hypothetical protein
MGNLYHSILLVLTRGLRFSSSQSQSRGISRAEFGEWSQRNCGRANSAWNQAPGNRLPEPAWGPVKQCHFYHQDWEWFLPTTYFWWIGDGLWHCFTIVLPLIADVKVVYIPTNRLVDFFRKKNLFPLDETSYQDESNKNPKGKGT